MNGCPRTAGLSILSRKWSYFVLRALRQPKGFSQLQHELRFITNHILSRELKLLQNEMLISQNNAQYSLSVSGKELLVAVEPLHTWGFTHNKMHPCPPELACSHCHHYTSGMNSKLQQ